METKTLYNSLLNGILMVGTISTALYIGNGIKGSLDNLTNSIETLSENALSEPTPSSRRTIDQTKWEKYQEGFNEKW